MSTGVTGVLLVAQIRDYGVDQATIGITFLTFSVGFVLAGFSSGAMTRVRILALEVGVQASSSPLVWIREFRGLCERRRACRWVGGP